MSKHLKDLLICLLSITILVLGCVGLYYGYKEYRKEQNFKKIWENDLQNITRNGVNNPYQIDDFVYKYGADELEDIEDDFFNRYCNYNIYTTKLDYGSSLEAKNYLNKFTEQDTQLEFFQNNPEEVFVLGKTYLSTKWIYNSEVNKEIFENIDKIARRYYHKDDSVQDIYQECLNFWNNSESFLSKNPSTLLYQKDKYRNFNHQIVSDILSRPDTLVRMSLTRDADGDILFYNTKYKYIVSLNFRGMY